MKRLLVLGTILGQAALFSTTVSADTTGDAGGSQPHSNLEPSLAINYLVSVVGAFPTRSDLPPATTQLGEVVAFAGNFAPNGFVLAHGQLLSISQNEALFSLLGTSYGGDGRVTFALPDFSGKTAISQGQGPGLNNYALGQTSGSTDSTLTEAQMPSHTHTFADGTTGPEGGGQAMSILQPSLAINYFYNPTGTIPSIDSGGGNQFLGRIRTTAANFAPGGYALNGQTLSTNQNSALYQLYGSTYGGDGQTHFNLPDLRGRAPAGTGTGPGLSPKKIGDVTGNENVTLSVSQLPPHQHTVPSDGVTSIVGGSQPYSNLQPSLGVSWIISLTGIYPTITGGAGDGTDPFIGEMTQFGGNFAPKGWAMCNGQILSISQNEALFSLLGPTYGGDGISTFALPDLRGRVAIGADADFPLGSEVGSEKTTLTIAQMADHVHSVPEPAALTLLCATAGASLLRRRKN